MSGIPSWAVRGAKVVAIEASSKPKRNETNVVVGFTYTIREVVVSAGGRMTVATNHQQHRTAQCRGGQGPVAASRTAHSPAAFNKHQDRSAARGRAGFFVRRTLLHGSSSQVTEPGLRARPFSHVGWCFNTARDFGSFPPLRLVKGLWLAWKSTSELRRARAQTSPPKITTSRENGRGPEQ